MTDYLYDGTFAGLLTCIYHHYYTDKAAGIYTKEEYQPSFLQGSKAIETDEEKASRVYDAINSKISDYALRMIYRAYLSSIPGKEMIILNYVVLGFRIGPSIGSMRALPEVLALEQITKKISVEKERMLQFVRFEVMKAEGPAGSSAEGMPETEILYAKIEPDHDVLELAANHFAERFSHDPLIIHDTRRHKAVMAYEGDWYITDFDGTSLPDGSTLVMSDAELQYQNLWRTYFDHISIKERINSRCQKNHMPVRYWKHLTEVNG